MDEGFDFSNASIDDFKVIDSSVQDQPIEPQQVEQQVTNEPIQSEPVYTSNVETPIESKPVDTTPVEYKFKDDFIKQAVEYYEKTGNLLPYLEVKTIDYNNMADEEIMRRNLREQYSDLSDKAFDRLYKQQVTDKYKLDADEWGEDDSELGRELLKAEASKVRNQYLEWQEKFKAPEVEPQIDTSVEDTIRAFEQKVTSNEFTKNFLNTNKVSIKNSDGEFQFEVPNSKQLLDMTIDNDKFFSQFATPDGDLDYSKWFKTAAYSQNPDLFERSLINYGKALGRQEISKEIKNPSNQRTGDVPTESSGDFMSGLLEAFASRGVHK